MNPLAESTYRYSTQDTYEIFKCTGVKLREDVSNGDTDWGARQLKPCNE